MGRHLRGLLSIVVLLVVVLPVFALTPKEQKGVKVLKSAALEYTSPDWFTPFSLGEAPEDITYWKSLLPEQDRYEKMYIVMPTLGMVSPVIQVPEGTEDYTTMAQGGEIDINKYLVSGVMHYPGAALPDQEGNIIIFGHSNYFKNRGVRYPAIFADIMNLDPIPSDEIWLFHVQDDGTYELYKYQVNASYETTPTDVEILQPTGGKELTVFACTNGLAGRWILRAKQLPDGELLVPSRMKVRVRKALEKLAMLTPEQQKEIVSRVLERIEQVRENGSVLPTRKAQQMRKYLLRWIEGILVAPPTSFS